MAYSMKKENNWCPLTIHTTNITQILHFFGGISELTVIHITSKDKAGNDGNQLLCLHFQKCLLCATRLGPLQKCFDLKRREGGLPFCPGAFVANYSAHQRRLLNQFVELDIYRVTRLRTRKPRELKNIGLFQPTW